MVFIWTLKDDAVGDVRCLKFDPNSNAPNGLWVAGYTDGGGGAGTGIRISQDKGETWSDVAVVDFKVCGINYTSSQKWACVGNNAAAYSSDGINWTKTTFACNASDDTIFYPSNNLAVDESYGASGIWITGGESGKIMYSIDSGVTWAEIAGVSQTLFGANYIMGVAYGGTNRWVIVDGSDPTRYSFCNGDPLVPGNWSVAANITGCASATGITITYDNGVWLVMNATSCIDYSSCGIYRTTDGTTWSKRTVTDYNDTRFSVPPAFAVYNSLDAMWITFNYDDGIPIISTDNGLTWTTDSGIPVIGYTGYYVGMVMDTTNDVLAVANYNGQIIFGNYYLVPPAPPMYTSNYDLGSTRKAFWLNRIKER